MARSKSFRNGNKYTSSNRPNRKVGGAVSVGPNFIRLTNALFNTDVTHLAKHYEALSNRYLVTNGTLWTCDKLKSYYVTATSIALGVRVKPLQFCKTDGRGYPMDILPFIPYLKSKRVDKRRAALTVLQCYTQLRSKPDCNVETITKPYPDSIPKLFIREYRKEFQAACKEIKQHIQPKIYDEGLYDTSKQGPNGAALFSCDKDFAAISRDHGGEILYNIIELNKQIQKIHIKNVSQREINQKLRINNSRLLIAPDDCDDMNLPRTVRKALLYQCMENFCKYREEDEPEVYNSVRTSKISFLGEKGCKTRVIAMADIFTQDALKPIHKSLMKSLRKLKTDGTYSHNRIGEVVKDRTKRNMPVISFDLTAATDRFPVFILTDCLATMYNKDLAKAWARLMVKRDFHVTITDRDSTRYHNVRYACGQPMGFLSSWSAFALTHHVIVRMCALRLGLTNFEDYVIIGDDVTIFNTEVAREYRLFLDRMNINISEGKSLQSGGSPSSAEIAKRLFKNGEELSPIPHDAIESAIENHLLFPNLMKLCLDRDIIKHDSFAPVYSILHEVYKNKRTCEEVFALLTFPSSNLATSSDTMTTHLWKCEADLINTIFQHKKVHLLKSRAKGYYENQLQLDIATDLGALGRAIQAHKPPILIEYHPLLVLLRAHREMCYSIYQNALLTHRYQIGKGLLRKFDSFNMEDIAYLIDPTIPCYIRRSHRIETIRSSLIIKTYKQAKRTSRIYYNILLSLDNAVL